jgi:hypothetical protein
MMCGIMATPKYLPLPPRQTAALIRAISPDRLAMYLSAASGDQDRAVALYLWDRDLAAAMFSDIAILEVALRNALNDALNSTYGPEWYTKDIGLDDRSRAALAAAWNPMPKAIRTQGRLVSRLMFGFWEQLLNTGGYVGKEPQAFKMNYEDLWRAGLSQAFRGGRHEARAAQARFSRDWTSGIVVAVKAIRNRAAHHEPFLLGVPLPGQKDQHGHPLRLSASEAHEKYMQLGRMLDRSLAQWLRKTSTVADLIVARP